MEEGTLFLFCGINRSVIKGLLFEGDGYYLKYLLDSMPSHMDDHDRSFLADMMPWSQAFKEYTAKEKAELIQKYRLNASDEPPIQTRCRSGPNKVVSA